MKRIILVAIVFLLVSAGTASADGFVVTYPPDSDNLSLEVGIMENVEVHLRNGLGVEVAVGISDNAGDTISVSYPITLIMSPGTSENVILTVYPRSEGNFDVAVHFEVMIPEEQGGAMGGQVIGGTDVPLRGTIAAAPSAEDGVPWSYVFLAVIVILGAVAYAIKRYWRKIVVVKKWHRSA